MLSVAIYTPLLTSVLPFYFNTCLDDLDGRVKDNTGFVKVKDFDKLSDNELYELLLKEFKQWLGR